MSLSKILTNLTLKEKVFIKFISALSLGALTLMVVFSPYLKKIANPEIFVSGPAGEQAAYLLTTPFESSNVNLNENDILKVYIRLDTCLNSDRSACASVNATEFLLSFDKNMLEPVDAEGNNIFNYPDNEQMSRFVEEGSIFNNYLFPTDYMDAAISAQNQVRLQDGKVYIVATNPNGYNSNGNLGDFAQIRFKAKAKSGTTQLTILTQPTTSGFSTKASMLNGPADIINQNLVGNNGNLTINFEGAPANYPAKLILEGPSLVKLGQEFDINLIVDTGNFESVGVDFLIDYDPKMLKINPYQSLYYDIYPNLADFNFDTPGFFYISKFWGPEDSNTNTNAGSCSNKPCFNGKDKLAKINFTPIAVGTTKITIRFDGQGLTTDSNVSYYSTAPIASGGGRDLLGNVINLTLNITPESPSPSPSPNCKQEGSVIDPINPEEEGCCPGLSQISCATPPNCLLPNTPCAICAKCGDGICKNKENYCNCPVDCPQSPPSPSPRQSPIPSFLPSPSPTPSPSPLACHYNADLNNDGLINSIDLSIVASYWCIISSNCKPLLATMCPSADLNDDGVVNSIDIQIFVPWWNPKE